VLQVRSLPHSDLPLDSSSDNGDDDDNYDDNDTNTHALHCHFHSKCGGCKFPFSFDGDEGDGDSSDDDNEDDDDNDDDLSKATLSSLASSGDSSSSACSTVCGNDPNWASCTSNPFQPSSNQNAFGRSNDTDVMLLLSCTNNSLQQRISSSDSSSLIGLRHNPECNAHAKAYSYKVGNDSSEVVNDCTSSSSDESASVDAGEPCIPMPNLFKPCPRSSFEVSNVPLSKGCAMTTGPVVNLHLGSPERGGIS
jgi:hypothetical protein